MFSAEVWVLIAFCCFFCFFGKKLYSALTTVCDEYSKKIEIRIADAEKLKENAAEMLSAAYSRKAEIEKSIEVMKAKSEFAVAVFKEDSEKHISLLKSRLEKELDEAVKAALNSRYEGIVKDLSANFTTELEALIEKKKPDIFIDVESLKKLKINK